jgi:hypothetical protein
MGSDLRLVQAVTIRWPSVGLVSAISTIARSTSSTAGQHLVPGADEGHGRQPAG